MKVKKLLVDSNAFFERIPLWEFGEEFYTLREVIEEIRDRHTRQHIDALPFELHCLDPAPEYIKFINDFTKKTGDFASLSLVDIKLLALTYELEKIAKGGTLHLRSVPDTERTEVVASRRPPPSNRTELPEGFYCPKKKNDFDIEEKTACELSDTIIGNETSTNAPSNDTHNCQKAELQNQTEPYTNIDTNHSLLNIENLKLLDERSNKLEQEENYTECNDLKAEFDVDICQLERVSIEIQPEEQPTENGSSSCTESKGEEVEEEVGIEVQPDMVFEDDGCTESEGEEEIDDAEGWITPQNLHKMKNLKNKDEEDVGSIEVACMTTDFAMQNTLRHIGLEVVGFNGKLIRNKKTFTLRCFACYKITNKMDRLFCPHCGHKTLQRVSVTLQSDGTQKIWLSSRKVNNTRGTKFSLPTPRTGKHAVNPILVADQRKCQDKPSKKMINKMNPLGQDYVAGNRPFGVRDVYSKSSQLGVGGQHTHRGTFYWEQKNPNEAKKNMSRRKKRT